MFSKCSQRKGKNEIVTLTKSELKKIADLLYGDSGEAGLILNSVKLDNGDLLYFFAEKLADKDMVKLYWCNSSSVIK